MFKQGIPGAKIDHIFNQAKVFNISRFSHVILTVGGNDASSNSDMEYFEECYEQVIQYFKKENSDYHIYLCTVCPRIDTDTSEVDEVIHRLCQRHNIGIIDLNQAFYDKQGSVIERYYVMDSIHMSASGVKRLQGVIDKEITVVENNDTCVFKTHQQNKGYMQNKRLQVNSPRHLINGSRKTKPRQYTGRDMTSACYKCGETNHETSRCRHAEQLKCFHCGFYSHKSGLCLNQ